MSELTKEKIYKKELEKVGGEGNNNLERIRSLGPYATVEYVNTLMSGALKRAIVEALPEEDIDTNTIYMVLDETASSGNVYNEYLYINEAWELIGTTAMEMPHLYEHRINIAGVDLVIYDTDNKDYSSKTNLINYLKSIGAIATSLTDYQHFHQATGFRKIGDDYNIVVGVVVYNDGFYVINIPTFNTFTMTSYDVYIPGALNQTTRQIF